MRAAASKLTQSLAEALGAGLALDFCRFEVMNPRNFFVALNKVFCISLGQQIA